MLCLGRVPIMSAFVRRILPPAVIILGMVVTAAWMTLLGYGLVTLVGGTLIWALPGTGATGANSPPNGLPLYIFAASTSCSNGKAARPSDDFRVIDHVIKAMRRAGIPADEIEKFCDEAMSSDDRELLRICGRRVTLAPH
jgi:hypothetical protein